MTLDLDIEVEAGDWDWGRQGPVTILTRIRRVGKRQLYAERPTIKHRLCSGGRLCSWALGFVQIRVEEMIRETVQEELNRRFGVLDFEATAKDWIEVWMEGLMLGAPYKTLLEESQFRFLDGRLSAAGFEVAVVVDRDWLGRDAEPLPEGPPDTMIGAVVSLALVNRVLATAFDRPLPEALKDLGSLAGNESPLTPRDSSGPGTGSGESSGLSLEQRIRELEKHPERLPPGLQEQRSL